GSRQNTILTDESFHLNPERDERNEINQSQSAQKNPTAEEIFRWFIAAPEGQRRQFIEEGAISGDDFITCLTDPCVSAKIVIRNQYSACTRYKSQNFEDGMCAGIHCSIGFNQLHRAFHLCQGNFSIKFLCFLQGKIIDFFAQPVSQSSYPAATE